MTKAEATVYNSPCWVHIENRIEDHASAANTYVNIYLRFEKFGEYDGFPMGKPTHRLCCYSSHGDSILWVRSNIENVRSQYEWEWYRDHSIHNGNIEYEYDRVLKDLI